MTMNDPVLIPNSEFNRESRDNEIQKIVTGRIKETKVGTEVISFYVDLGPFRIVCVANVPADNEKEAPVYVKFMLNNNKR